MRTLLNFLVIILSLTTASGVLLHDARIDKAAAMSWSAKRMSNKRFIAPTDGGLTTNAHTHPQHSARTLHGFSYRMPSHPPRNEVRMKRVIQQQQEPQGRHAFDHSYLPVVE